MYLMLQQENPEDFVIATGESNSLEKFVSVAFKSVDLDWRNYVVIDKSLYRPAEILEGKGNAQKAKNKLGWQAKYGLEEVIRTMMAD